MLWATMDLLCEMADKEEFVGITGNPDFGYFDFSVENCKTCRDILYERTTNEHTDSYNADVVDIDGTLMYWNRVRTGIIDAPPSIEKEHSPIPEDRAEILQDELQRAMVIDIGAIAEALAPGQMNTQGGVYDKLVETIARMKNLDRELKRNEGRRVPVNFGN